MADRKTKSRRPIWVKMLLVFGGLLILLLLLFADFGRYRERSVCNQCGMHKTATLYQIPLTEVTIGMREKLESTSLCAAMFRHHFCGTHAHTWKFAYGRGNAIPCALGRNEDIYFRASNAYIGIFVDMLVDYRGRDVAERWCRRVLAGKREDRAIVLMFPSQRISRDEFDAYTDEYSKELLLK